jgi:diaminopimelate epimerase
MRFYKYHALGNDYIVIHPDEMKGVPSSHQIRTICHRNFGIGSDGILLGPLETGKGEWGLRIFNPDGSEAEKSGNGLRIFSRYLWDTGRVRDNPFTLSTLGGPVISRVSADGRIVAVEMGRVTFNSADIPVAGKPREVIDEIMHMDDRELRFCAASIGNPHCVIPCDRVMEKEARQWGPRIENDPRFPNRINVQFMQVLDRQNIKIEIWERGAGYTLASGSSSSAAAAVAKRLGFCDEKITVHMPGGTIEIEIAEDDAVTMTGEVTRVCDGTIAAEMFEDTHI